MLSVILAFILIKREKEKWWFIIVSSVKKINKELNRIRGVIRFRSFSSHSYTIYIKLFFCIFSISRGCCRDQFSRRFIEIFVSLIPLYRSFNVSNSLNITENVRLELFLSFLLLDQTHGFLKQNKKIFYYFTTLTLFLFITFLYCLCIFLSLC